MTTYPHAVDSRRSVRVLIVYDIADKCQHVTVCTPWRGPDSPERYIADCGRYDGENGDALASARMIVMAVNRMNPTPEGA